MAKAKQEIRAEQVAVSDDQSSAEGKGAWLVEGAWVAIVCADPVYYGQVEAVTPSHIYLRDASWIPDTGRAHTFVANPQSCVEAEYLGDVAVERPVVAVYRVAKGGKVATK